MSRHWQWVLCCVLAFGLGGVLIWAQEKLKSDPMPSLASSHVLADNGAPPDDSAPAAGVPVKEDLVESPVPLPSGTNSSPPAETAAAADFSKFVPQPQTMPPVETGPVSQVEPPIAGQTAPVIAPSKSELPAAPPGPPPPGQAPEPASRPIPKN